MSAWNPGTALNDIEDGDVIVDVTDLPTPSTQVKDISNNPSAVLTVG